MPLDHYISQVHLRNFYSPALGSRMYATRKSDLKSFTPDSSSVCRIEDGSTNTYLREDRAIEEFLRTIEPKYNMALEKLFKEEIDSACIYTIAGFIAYVSTCSPAAMRISSGSFEGIVEGVLESAEGQGRITLPSEELAGKSLANLFRDGDIEIAVDRKYPQAVGISSIRRFVTTFGNFKWDILLNQFDKSPFFTSDFPVAIERTEDLLNLIVPLAPNLAVRIRPDLFIDSKRDDLDFANFGWRSRCISHKELVDINQLIVRCAEDTVFYRDDLPWVQRFIAKNRYYRIEPITITRPEPDGLIQISTLSIKPFSRPA
jgi:Protein of unknown function (DUF4238)